jgi:AraC family transcriptional regulator
MIKHTLFALAIGMALFFLYLMQYTGAFKGVTIGTDERGPFLLIYKNHTGAYHKIIDHIQAAESWALAHKIPHTVEEGRLKSRAGCLIENYTPAQMEEVKKSALPPDFQVAEFPKTKAVVALFSGSPGIGPFKVYPKAEDYIKLNKYMKKGSVLEKYEVLGKRALNTTYYWPIE